MDHSEGQRYVIAHGSEPGGLKWTVWARRDEPQPGDLLSMIRVTDATGRILHAGGGAGPSLYPGHVMNVTVGGSEEGPRALLARVDPRVRRVDLRTETGDRRSVPLYDSADIPEVRFASLLVPRDLPLESVAGYDERGDELERFDLRFHQGRWEARFQRPGPPAAADAGTRAPEAPSARPAP